jgi:hypothetical protein
MEEKKFKFPCRLFETSHILTSNVFQSLAMSQCQGGGQLVFLLHVFISIHTIQIQSKTMRIIHHHTIEIGRNEEFSKCENKPLDGGKTSQNRSVSSPAPVQTCRPSGATAMCNTRDVCPAMVARRVSGAAPSALHSSPTSPISSSAQPSSSQKWRIETSLQKQRLFDRRERMKDYFNIPE